MRRQGIEVRLQARVQRVTDQYVLLAGDEMIAGGTVICTIGSALNPLIDSLSLPKERGRLATAADMSVPGCPGIWALGDCAAVINGGSGKTAPPTAQFAVQQAKQLSRNIARQLRGKPTQAFTYRPRGQLSTITKRWRRSWAFRFLVLLPGCCGAESTC
jgi:NADH dehydrogenase